MPSNTRGLMLALMVLVSGSSAVGQLVDAGTSGQYFLDTSTGMYWQDPAQFVGQSRSTIDAFVQASSTWQWATGAQVNALNGKSAPAGLTLEDVMGPRQVSLTNGGPRWAGYHSSAAQPDGWLAQSFNSPGFTTIDGVSHQHFVGSYGPGAWLVSTSPPTPPNTLTLSQPQGAGSILIQVSGPPNANYFMPFSFNPANSTSPGTGWWQGLHISLLDLATQVAVGAPPVIGTLDSLGSASYSLPGGSLPSSLPEIFAVTTFYDVTWSIQLGSTSVESIIIL